MQNSHRENKEASLKNEFFRLATIKLDASEKEGIAFVLKQRSVFIGQANVAGRLKSGGTFVMIADIFFSQIKIRARAIIETLEEVYRAFDFELIDNVNVEIMGFCSGRLEKEKAGLLNEMLSDIPFGNAAFKALDVSGKLREKYITELDSVCRQEKELLEANITLSLRKLAMNKTKPQGSPTVNVAGNVGNLQIGDNNTITINESSKAAILTSFSEIRSTLKNTGLIDAVKYQEIDNLMQECEAEIKKGTPNTTRIGACLGAVGSTIKGIATLGGAYSAIKMLSPIFGGPHLP